VAPLTGEASTPVKATPPGVEPQAAIQAEADEEKSLTEAGPPPPQNRGGAARPAIELKKAMSKKKASKQARAIIVATPKEEAEMVDIGMRPKKRGRQRKVPNVDPPDPHKGSVLYPEKGVCADPVDEGAILGRGGPSPHSSDRERQLAPDIGRGKT
jgi:hypothetical protein